MCPSSKVMNSQKCLDDYFLEHRAKLLDIAAFLDRIERSSGFSSDNLDFRHQAFLQALRQLADHPIGQRSDRTEMVHLAFSDMSALPLESASGLKGAYGAVKNKK